MGARLFMWWRALGTGFCFAGYGLGSLLATVTILPVLLLWPGSPARRQRRVRWAISCSFRALLATIAALRLGRVEIEGRQWLVQAQGKLVVATHPMYLDVVALIALLPDANCVVKNALWRNPFTHAFVRAGGYISNADPERLMDACIHSVQCGQSLILFPQGTRAVPGESLRFRRGAAQVAVRGNCEILPVLIRCSPPALLKSTRWYQVPDQPWRLRVKMYPPQPFVALMHEDRLPYGIAARRVNQALEHFFEQQLTNHEQFDRRTEATDHHRAGS